MCRFPLLLRETAHFSAAGGEPDHQGGAVIQRAVLVHIG